MAKPTVFSNFFSVLPLHPDSDDGVEDADAHQPCSSMPIKKHASKKKRRKSAAAKSMNSVQELVDTLPRLTIENSNAELRLKENNDSHLRLKQELEIRAHEKEHSSTNGKKDHFASLELKTELSLGLSAGAKKAGINTAQKIATDRWPLVWIDLEMTGLNSEKDRILEIACIITDGKLQNMIEGPDLIIKQSEEILARMGPWCQTHHTASGLVEGVRKSKVTERQAEEEVLAFIHRHIGIEPEKHSLAGNSIYVDFTFLKKYMPDLAKIFHHVVVDVSSITALCMRWYPKDAERAPTKKKMHRALEDIKESITELRYMQKTIFKENKR